MRWTKRKSPTNTREVQIIFYEGNPPLAVYCVYSGIVKLFKTTNRHKKVAIRLLGAGEIIGYRAIVANEPYAATAEAVETTTVCTISKEVFEDLMLRDSGLALRLTEKLARELRTSEDQMVRRTQESVMQRTAGLLVWLLDNLQAGYVRKNTIAVPLLREEMAQMIGTTPETLSRILRELAARRVVEVKRMTISVTKPRVLRSIADEQAT